MFGDRLKELRKNNSESQEALGNICGVASNTISNWEYNKTEPDIEQIIKIANHYGVSIDYLFGIECEEKQVDALKKALIEAGFDVTEDLTKEDLEKALSIVNMLKGDR